MQLTLVHIKSLQDAGGALVAESGCLKIVQVRAVAATRRANTQTSGHPAQHSQQRAVAVLPTGDRSEQQHQENNTALATSSVCPRAMQAVRSGCGKKPLKPEKEICACGDVLGFFGGDLVRALFSGVSRHAPTAAEAWLCAARRLGRNGCWQDPAASRAAWLG
ncbi:hypothetical protein ERJ75_001550900 [Trypanosoma vivax]|nr:hypothetical protein ERJ75_001550900 [Trypanosoma vivax]